MSKDNPSDHLDLDPIISVPKVPKWKLPEITPLTHWLSGEAVFNALKKAVDDLRESAPTDHDVLIQAFGITVIEVSFVEPHTFLLSGFDEEGNNTSVVVHFTQLLTHIVYLPKRGKKRIVVGFGHIKDSS
jgi:hypothetical protein